VAGFAAMVEMIYHLQLNAAMGDNLHFMGLMLDTRGINSWLGALALLLVGGALFEMARRRFVGQWSLIQEDIELKTKRGETQ
jgi:branched-chain amino acid transport system permease protein